MTEMTKAALGLCVNGQKHIKNRHKRARTHGVCPTTKNYLKVKMMCELLKW